MAFRLPTAWSEGLQDPKVEITYNRPTDWPTMTPTNREIKFLVGDSYPSYQIYATMSGTASVIIDWGNGVTASLQDGVTASNTYVKGTGATCSQGYTTFQIRIYGDGTPNTKISWCKILGSGTQSRIGLSGPCQVLEAYYGDDTIDNLKIGTSGFTGGLFENSWINNTGVEYKSLRYVRLPATMSGDNFTQAFANCTELQKIDMPTSAPNMANIENTFRNTVNLQEVILPADAPVSNMTATFFSAVGLKRVYLPNNLNNFTGGSSGFDGCAQLEYVNFPETPNCAVFTGMFTNCSNLKWINIPYVAVTTSFNSAFNVCTRLRYVNFPKTIAGTGIDLRNAFQSCVVLEKVIIPEGWNITNISGIFNGCSALREVDLPSAVNVGDLANIFINCGSLEKIRGWNTNSTDVTLMNSAFQNCSNLKELPPAVLSANYINTNFTNAFNGCIRLGGVITFTGTWTNLNCAFMFANCQTVTEINFPSGTSGAATQAFNNTFANCWNLRRITNYNATGIGVVMTSAFDNCYNLTDVTPYGTNGVLDFSTMSMANSLSATFRFCYSLRKITIGIPNNSTNYVLANSFEGCANMEEIIFPAQTLTNNTQTGSALATTLSSNNQPNKAGTSTPHTNGVISTNMFRFWQSTSATVYVLNQGFRNNSRLQTLELGMRISYLLADWSHGGQGPLRSLRLFNNATGQYAAAAVPLDIFNQSLDTAALIQLFTDLPVVTGSRTIRITGNPGVSGLSAGDRAIATGKGWTINETT